MDALGAEEAVNLDGGGSTGMMLGRRLVTRPRMPPASVLSETQ
jgi:exopolysaccharide biosynthesis protein